MGNLQSNTSKAEAERNALVRIAVEKAEAERIAAVLHAKVDGKYVKVFIRLPNIDCKPKEAPFTKKFKIKRKRNFNRNLKSKVNKKIRRNPTGLEQNVIEKSSEGTYNLHKTTRRQLQVQNKSKQKIISKLSKTDKNQKKSIERLSSQVKEMSDLLKKEKKASNEIIDTTTKLASSKINKAECLLQSGKDYHDKALKLRGEAVKLRHEAVAISQRSETKIKKLEKEIVQLCSRQESLHDKVITANNSCQVLKAVVQEHKSIHRSLVQDNLTIVKNTIRK